MKPPHCEQHGWFVYTCTPCMARYRAYRRARGKDRQVRVYGRLTTVQPPS